MCTLSHFWHPSVGLTQRRRIPRIWFGSGSCDRSQPSLKLPSLVVPGGKWLTFFQVGGIPTSERQPHWSPKQHDKDVANPNQVVCFISCQDLCTQFEWLNLEFQFTATNFVSMAAKSSDLGDRTSGANLQIEGHMDMPPQSAKDLGESEALGGSPSHLPSWSLARRPPSSHPNTRYCLEIHVTLTEELGAVPLPSHFWMAPLVEDMLHNARTSLTKAVVIGPGRAVLFYGRHSLGEGLTID